MTQPVTVNVDLIYQDIRQLIEDAKVQVVSQVNQALVLTYWQIGKRIKTQVLQDDRAQYGAGVIKQLAQQLTREYGNGFSHSSLTRMAKFYGYLPEQQKVATLSQQLSWSHFVELIKIEDELKSAFYIRLCSDARWPVRTLRERIDSMLYERTALSKQADIIIAQELAAPTSPQLFLKDPYPIKRPSLQIIQQFNAVADSLVPKLHSNAVQIRTLEKLRNTLLPKLMSGEVRVKL